MIQRVFTFLMDIMDIIGTNWSEKKTNSEDTGGGV